MITHHSDSLNEWQKKCVNVEAAFKYLPRKFLILWNAALHNSHPPSGLISHCPQGTGVSQRRTSQQSYDTQQGGWGQPPPQQQAAPQQRYSQLPLSRGQHNNILPGVIVVGGLGILAGLGFLWWAGNKRN